MSRRIGLAWAWLRARPTIADGLLALALAALALFSLRVTWGVMQGITEPDLLAVGLALMMTLPLTFRRWRPMLVYAAVGITTVVYAQLGYPSSIAGLGVLIALYTVATMVPLREALTAGGIYVVGMLLSLIAVYERVGAPDEVFIQDLALNLLILVLAWTVGVTVRTRRAYIAELEARAALLEREREENAQLAIALERGRIGRELHDVVAHAVSLMVVQAAAAQRLVARDPERAAASLGTIAGTGRQALGEMRRLLGSLRDGDGSDGLRPQPGLADLEGLVERLRSAGLAVELSVQGQPRPLASIIELSAYRIVQEALTNTLKHAGPARARVILRYAADALEVQVTDDGSAAEDRREAAEEGGHGLIGMRERIALFQGALEAGPRAEGGYAVRARIPLTDSGV